MNFVWFVYTHIYIYIYILHTQAHTHMHTHTHTHTRTHTYIYIYIYILFIYFFLVCYFFFVFWHFLWSFLLTRLLLLGCARCLHLVAVCLAFLPSVETEMATKEQTSALAYQNALEAGRCEHQHANSKWTIFRKNISTQCVLHKHQSMRKKNIR